MHNVTAVACWEKRAKFTPGPSTPREGPRGAGLPGERVMAGGVGGGA